MRRGSWMVIGLLLGCLTHADHAAAQLYQWRDTNGRVVFSDTPPPPNTPPGNIIKSPKGRSAPAPAPVAAAAADGTAKDGATKDGAAPANASGPKSVAERDAEYKKRQADAAEKSKKDQEASAEAQRRDGICKALRQNLASLEAGQRVRKIDEKGEPYFIEDAERAREVTRIRGEMTATKCG